MLSSLLSGQFMVNLLNSMGPQKIDLTNNSWRQRITSKFTHQCMENESSANISAKKVVNHYGVVHNILRVLIQTLRLVTKLLSLTFPISTCSSSNKNLNKNEQPLQSDHGQFKQIMNDQLEFCYLIQIDVHNTSQQKLQQPLEIRGDFQITLCILYMVLQKTR